MKILPLRIDTKMVYYYYTGFKTKHEATGFGFPVSNVYNIYVDSFMNAYHQIVGEVCMYPRYIRFVRLSLKVYVML